MGDGGGEAGSQLLVGGQVAGTAQVEERLPAPVDLVVDLERRAAVPVLQHTLGQRGALVQSLERLPSPPTRGDHVPVLVEHDDDLTALLDQDVRAFGSQAHIGRLFGVFLVVPPAEEPRHGMFTFRSPDRSRVAVYRRLRG